MFLHQCKVFVEQRLEGHLPRMAVQGIVTYARIAKSFEGCRRGRHVETPSSSTSPEAYVDIARNLLETASDLCKMDFENAKELQTEIEQISGLYERAKYEPVTADEIAALKTAMVTGAAGIATHSGHWYKCRNGHTVCFPARSPSQTTIFYADRDTTVCHRRVRDAHGTSLLSRMPSPNWRTEPHAGRRRDPGYGYGVVVQGIPRLIVVEFFDSRAIKDVIE